MSEEKSKLSIYWAASCGGCEIAVVNTNEKLLEVDAAFDLVFCPCLVDTKKKDLEAMPDGSIDVTLFNGAIRTSENEEMAHIMRAKSKTLVAFGSCAMEGGIPSLSNFSSRQAHFDAIYRNNPSIDNPEGVVPQEETVVPEGTLYLPRFFDRVKTLAQVVPVDYFIPGCPPEPHQISAVLDVLMSGTPLPPKGSVLGAGNSTVCQECPRQRGDKKIERLVRTWQIIPDTEQCLLEQGLICMGVVTRDGCRARCPQVNMPCIGCYGAPEGVIDQGGKMASALGSMLDIKKLKQRSEADINEMVEKQLDAIPDYAGTFYKFCMAGSLLQAQRGEGEG